MISTQEGSREGEIYSCGNYVLTVGAGRMNGREEEMGVGGLGWEGLMGEVRFYSFIHSREHTHTHPPCTTQCASFDQNNQTNKIIAKWC